MCIRDRYSPVLDGAGATDPYHCDREMPAEEFRRYGHEVIDWIADYMAHIRDYPVLAKVVPGDLVDRLPASAPETGEPMDAILADFQKLIMPAITHWNHPSFHAYFSVSSSGPGVLAEALSATLNMNGMLWKTSPAVTELEQVTLGWLREWMGLPADWFGICLLYTSPSPRDS